MICVLWSVLTSWTCVIVVLYRDKTPAVVEKLRNGAPTPLLAELPKETKLTPQKMQASSTVCLFFLRYSCSISASSIRGLVSYYDLLRGVL